MVKDERKVVTIRISPELKFQIDKAAAEDCVQDAFMIIYRRKDN